MTLKSNQELFNDACAKYDINSEVVKAIYEVRTNDLNKNNWHDLAMRYYNLKLEAMNNCNYEEAAYYNNKYQDAWKRSKNNV